MLPEAINNFETELFLGMNGHWGKGWDYFFYSMSDKLIWIPLYLFILFLIYRRWGWKTALAVLCFIGFSVIAVDQICNVFKHGFEKLRPTHTPYLKDLVHTVNGYRGGLYGTFSAHAATTACIATFSMLVIRRWLFSLSLVFWVLLVSYSRIYLGVHFPTDILFGMMTGTLMGVMTFLIFKWSRMRRFYAYS